MGGQIVDASHVPAPKQRNIDGEKDAVQADKTAAEIWPSASIKAIQKDTDGRWALKVGGEMRHSANAVPLSQIAQPIFA